MVMKVTFKEFVKIVFCVEIVVLFAVAVAHIASLFVENGFSPMDYVFFPLAALVVSLFGYFVLLPIFARIMSIGGEGE
jgi:hypothetical protein